MRWRRAAVGVAMVAAVAWSAIAIAQQAIEREARALLDAWVSSPPAPFTAFKYGGVSFDLAQRRLRVDNVELTGAPDTKRLAIETVTVTDPQPAALDSVINPARYQDGKGGGDFMPVASLVQLQNVSIEATDGTGTTIAAVGVSAVALRQFAVAPTAENLGDDGIKVLGIVLPGIRIGEMALDTIVVRKANSAEEAGVERIRIRGVDAGRMQEARLEGLRFSEDGKEGVTLRALMVAGVDLRGALPDMAAGRPVSSTDPERKVHYDRWEMLALGGSALAEHGFRLERAGAEVTRSADRTTERVDFRVEGIELAKPAGADSPVSQMLAGLGYPALKGTIGCISDSDNIRKTWKLEPCGLSIPGAGTLSLTWSFSGVDIKTPTGSDGLDTFFQSLAAASFDWVRIVYKDEGLANRAVSLAAKSSGQDAAAFRQALVRQIRQGAEAYGAGSRRVRDVANAAAAFLNRPGTLTVALEPGAPVAFGTLDPGMLADVPAAAERLGLTGRHAP